MSRAWLVPVVSLLAATAWASPTGLQSMTLGRGPTIVMIHNLGGGRMGWMPTAKKLLPNYRVVLVDLPGHGDSPLPDPFTLEAGANQLAQVLAAQKAESTIVVAQGMGALMALMALNAHPGAAKGLVAIEMSLKKQLAISDQQREAFFSMMDQNYDFFLKRMFMGLGRDSAQGIAIYDQAARVPAPTIKAYFREMARVDPAESAKNTKAPLLLIATDRIWGAAKDSTTFVTMMGYDALGSFTLRHLGNCGLLVASEQPDSLAALISGFSHRMLAAK
jgi:pimeloyl-ACP methyl ester carboxylesterase